MQFLRPFRSRALVLALALTALAFLASCAVDAAPPADVPSSGASSDPAPPRVAERPEVQRDDHDHGLIVEDASAWQEALAAGGVLQDTGEAFTQVSYLLDGPELFDLEYRLRDADGVLTDWQPLELTWHEEEAGVGRLFLEAPAEAFEVRGPEGAVVFATFQFHEEHVSDPDVLARNLPMEVEDKAASLPPWVVTRAGWGARNPGRVCGSAHTPRQLTIHHTVTPNNDSLSPAARMRQIQAYHIDGNGWCDVGYHFMVGIDGRVYEGRNNRLRTGAHVRVANRDNVGINLVGNFMSFEPRQVQLDGAGQIVGWLAERHNITLNRTSLRGHQEFMATACPGTRLQARLGEIIDRARGDQTPPTPPPPAPPTTPVDPVEPPGPETANLVGFVREGSIQNADAPIAGAVVTTDDGRTATTGANGFYRFEDVPLRTYRVTATADGYMPSTVSRAVDRTGTEYYASIALQPGARTATLTGFVREDSIDNDARPVGGATVTLDDGRTATTSASGVYRFEQVELGERTVTVDAAGYQQGTASRILEQAGTLYYASVALVREPQPTPPGLDVPIDALARMEVRWERLGDGSWKFQAVAPAEVTEVAYFVDGFPIRSSTDRARDFDARYRFEQDGLARSLEAVGFDGSGQAVSWAMGLLDVTDTVGVFVRQLGANEFEIGLERAPWAARFLEVLADGFALTDSVSGETRTDRQAVRYRFQHLGERHLVLNTYNLDGSYRGTLRRTVTLR